MVYKTRLVRNLFNNDPYSLETDEGKLKRFVGATGLEATAEIPREHSEYRRIRLWEFTFFSSYKVVVEISRESGYSDDLMRQILRDFEVPGDFAEKLMADEQFIDSLKGFFRGISCDGQRAATTLQMVYDTIAQHFRANT